MFSYSSNPGLIQQGKAGLDCTSLAWVVRNRNGDWNRNRRTATRLWRIFLLWAGGVFFGQRLCCTFMSIFFTPTLSCHEIMGSSNCLVNCVKANPLLRMRFTCVELVGREKGKEAT